MDIDVFAAAHNGDWERLERLVRRRRRLDGAEVDELVDLYQRVSTHLSVVRSSGQDPALVGRLSALVARARSAVTGAHDPAWRDLVGFFTRVFPAILYRLRWWWLGMTAGTVGIAAAVAWWIVADPAVMHAMGTPEYVAQVVEYEFANYYVENPRGSFAAQVWTNNAWVAAQAILYGVAFGVPTLYVMLLNALNLGAMAGLMIGHGRADVFFGLILPHGLLELTAVFVAGGIGLRLGWSLIAPGDRTRLRAFAEEGRSAVAAALGLAVVLFISGLIEGLVTGNTVAGHIPIPVALGIGVLAEVLFLLYVFVVGRRAHLEGETGDIRNAPAAVPVA
ncbi:stage II sporulation protein M [Nocardiopsis changdeensis]|uniref:Stage II sporulation protein M n=1 Tax=Nocardiopsis changdeensis TaxID=2831969 RepID=A0ABX8BSU7_9ACTN|nr:MULTISPECIES: stage II sporulation protein M [Nocardiopsis]QUX23833.1 stage II sporulation protein M [Nocardiopsis changdeensis]QYX39778.1 stage II sporulation protein M [Nocardiopsis sp. MT53]